MGGLCFILSGDVIIGLLILSEGLVVVVFGAGEGLFSFEDRFLVLSVVVGVILGVGVGDGLCFVRVGVRVGVSDASEDPLSDISVLLGTVDVVFGVTDFFGSSVNLLSVDAGCRVGDFVSDFVSVVGALGFGDSDFCTSRFGVSSDFCRKRSIRA